MLPLLFTLALAAAAAADARPPADVVELFRVYYGPANRAFAALDAAGQEALRSELEALWTQNNQAGNGRTEVAAEYLEVVATRR